MRGYVPVPPGMVLGHEAAGRVVEAGAEVSRVKKGDRVIASFVPACGACWHCLHEQSEHDRALGRNVEEFADHGPYRRGRARRPCREFASVPGAGRQFEIPIEHYCAATGTAVSADYVRELMRGAVHLSSPTGVGWEGMIQANMRRTLDGPLPGFLPIERPAGEGSISVEIRLRRPGV